MIARVIRASFAKPLLALLLVLAGVALGDRLLPGSAARRLPRPLRARLQRHRPEPRHGRRGAGGEHRRAAGGGAGRAAVRAAHPVQLPARGLPGDDRVRARRRLLPGAPARGRACHPGRRPAPARHRCPAGLEPHRSAQRDLRVHAGGRARDRRPHDAARPGGVRRPQPAPGRARRRRRRGAGRTSPPVPGAARHGPAGRARRDPGRGDPRPGRRQRERRRRLHRPGLDRMGGPGGGTGRRDRRPPADGGGGALGHAGAPGRRGRRPRGCRRPPRHRPPAARRGRQRAHRQAVRRRHGGGGAGHPRRRARHPGFAAPGRHPAHGLRPVRAGPFRARRGHQGGPARRGARGARALPAAGRRAGSAHRHPDHSLVGGAGRGFPAPGRRRAQHHDPGRAGHRGRAAGRRGHHRHGERRPSPLLAPGLRPPRHRPRSRGGGGTAHRLCHAHRGRGLPSPVRHERHRRPHVPPAGRGRGGHRGGVAGPGPHADPPPLRAPPAPAAGGPPRGRLGSCAG